MSLSFLHNAVSSVNWWLVAQYGLEATTLALTTWLASSKPVDHSVTPLAVGPSSPPSRKTRKSEAHMSKQKAEPQLCRSARLRKEAPVETLPQAPRKKVSLLLYILQLYLILQCLSIFQVHSRISPRLLLPTNKASGVAVSFQTSNTRHLSLARPRLILFIPSPVATVPYTSRSFEEFFDIP